MKSVPSERIAAALVASHGMVAGAARIIGVARSTVYRRIQRSPKLLEVVSDERECMLDVAEQKLFEAIEAGDVTAIKYYLSTQGRSRGYVTRTETDLRSDSQRLEFTLNIGETHGDNEEQAR